MKFLTHNLALKLLALGAAFGLWLNIASEKELATIVSIPVQYKNYPKDLEISSRIVDSVNVEARGPASQLRGIRDSEVAAVLDFSNVRSPGELTFAVANAELKLPRGVQLIRTTPAQLRFRFERPKTVSVPVEVMYSGSLPDGTSLGRVKVTPSQLQITGPESRVLAARKAITDPFDLTRATGDADQRLSVYVDDPEVRVNGDAHVTVKVQLERHR